MKINEIDLTDMSVQEITDFIRNTNGKLCFVILTVPFRVLNRTVKKTIFFNLNLKAHPPPRK
jgi:hypothetical protein